MKIKPAKGYVIAEVTQKTVSNILKPDSAQEDTKNQIITIVSVHKDCTEYKKGDVISVGQCTPYRHDEDEKRYSIIPEDGIIAYIRK